MVCAAGPLPVADEWAPTFWGLDHAWLKAHKEALTTQTFLSTLSTFMMVKGQIPPSSTEANYVRDIARSVAKVRLGLMLDKGPHYGLDKEGETQASTAGDSAQQPESAADPLPPAERLAALDMAIANLEQADQADDHALSMALIGTERALQTRDTDSLSGAPSCRLTRTICYGPGRDQAR